MRLKVKLLLSSFFQLLLILTVSAESPPKSKGEGKPDAQMSFLEDTGEITGVFATFLGDPSVENYLSGLHRIAASRHLVPLSDNCSIKGGELLNANNSKGVINLVDGPECIQTIFVPRHHYLLSAAYRKLQDFKRANSERPIGGLLLDVITKSGDGSKDQPYRVLDTLAQEDLVKFRLKEEIKLRENPDPKRPQQSRVTLKSGKEIWFDAPKVRPATKEETQMRSSLNGSSNQKRYPKIVETFAFDFTIQ